MRTLALICALGVNDALLLDDLLGEALPFFAKVALLFLFEIFFLAIFSYFCVEQ